MATRFAGNAFDIDVGSAMSATPPPVSSFSTQPTAFDSSSFSSSFDTSNLAGDLGTEVGKTASVTITPVSTDGGRFRIFEKNDGDSSVYTAPDKSRPHWRRTKVRSDDVTFPGGGDLAYPRLNKVGATAQGVAQMYTKDGNHFASVDDENKSVQENMPYPDTGKLERGETYTDDEMNYFNDYQGSKFKEGTNSYVLDSNDADDFKKLSHFMGSGYN